MPDGPTRAPDPTGGVPPLGGGNESVVARGSTRTFGGQVYEWDGSRWFPTGVSDPQARNEALTFEQQQALRGTPSVSSSTSQSFQDPAVLAENVRQFDATYAQKDAQNAREAAQAQATQAFLQQKEAFAEAQDNTRLLNEARQQAFTNNLTLVNLQTQRQQMQAQRDQFNATMQMQIAQANRDAERQRTQDLEAVNRDVASFAGDATDYGKLAAFQQGHGGWGQAAGASGNADFRTEQSLQPLAGALANRETLSRPAQQIQYNPLAPLPMLDLSSLTNQPPATTTSQRNGSLSNVWGGELSGNNAADAFAGTGTQGMFVDALKATGYKPANTNAQGDIPAAANGGMQRGAYISGEAGPELNIPMGKGKALVLNAEQMAKMKGNHIKALAEMATGGVFDNGNILNLDALDTTQARQFGNDAFARGLQNAGLSNVPTPVYASSPGFSPIAAQLYGGLGALAGRGPADLYQQQARQLAPTSYAYNVVARQQPVGRTA